MKTYPFTKDGAAEFVSYLASDPPEVLATEHITGMRGSDTCCVVANAFKAAFPDLTTVLVTHGAAFMTRDVIEMGECGHVETRYEQMEVQFPEQISDLIEEFDGGERPELEASPCATS